MYYAIVTVNETGNEEMFRHFDENHDFISPNHAKHPYES